MTQSSSTMYYNRVLLSLIIVLNPDMTVDNHYTIYRVGSIIDDPEGVG